MVPYAPEINNPILIYFHSEDIKFTLKQKKMLKNWIYETISTEQCQLGNISYIFCSDKYLHKMNVKYLNHDTYTDIITFDYSEDKLISGDLFISYERVKQNARTYNKYLIEELHRVMIHGVLHLCGYGDKTESEKKQMRSKEDHYLSVLLSMQGSK